MCVCVCEGLVSLADQKMCSSGALSGDNDADERGNRGEDEKIAGRKDHGRTCKW